MTVTLYTTPGCSGCILSKRVLDAEGISYDMIDVTTDASALQTVQDLGYSQAPVVVINDGEDHWSGFIPDRIKALAA